MKRHYKERRYKLTWQDDCQRAAWLPFGAWQRPPGYLANWSGEWEIPPQIRC